MSDENSTEDKKEDELDLESLIKDDIVDDKGKSTGEETQQEEVALTAIEQKASDQGWTNKKDFKGNEDNYKTAKEYVRDGEWMAKFKRVESKVTDQQNAFDERIANVNKLNKVKTGREIAKLRAGQRDAVDDRDTEGYDDKQKQIDELEKDAEEANKSDKVESKSTEALHPSIAAWNEKSEKLVVV